MSANNAVTVLRSPSSLSGLAFSRLTRTTAPLALPGRRLDPRFNKRCSAGIAEPGIGPIRLSARRALGRELRAAFVAELRGVPIVRGAL